MSVGSPGSRCRDNYTCRDFIQGDARTGRSPSLGEPSEAESGEAPQRCGDPEPGRPVVFPGARCAWPREDSRRRDGLRKAGPRAPELTSEALARSVLWGCCAWQSVSTVFTADMTGCWFWKPGCQVSLFYFAGTGPLSNPRAPPSAISYNRRTSVQQLCAMPLLERRVLRTRVSTAARTGS